jgi:hypothetical protein
MMLAAISRPSSQEALETATQHPFYRVRGQAYQILLDQIDRKRGLPLAQRALDDAHSLVRQCGLEYLSFTCPPEARLWLTERMDRPEFRDLDLVEQRRYYSTLSAIVGQELVPWLEARLSKPGLQLFSSTENEQICVVGALADLRAASVRPTLETMADSWLIKGRVKEALKTALQQLDRPPAAKTMRRRIFGSTLPEQNGGDAEVRSARPTLEPVGRTPRTSKPPNTFDEDTQKEILRRAMQTSAERTRARTQSLPAATAQPGEDRDRIPIATDEREGTSYVYTRKNRVSGKTESDDE